MKSPDGLRIDRKTLESKALGDRIRLLRRRILKVSQGKLATMLGLQRGSTVSDWERGIHVPPQETMMELAEKAGVDFTAIFAEFYDGSIQPGLVRERRVEYEGSEEFRILLELMERFLRLMQDRPLRSAGQGGGGEGITVEEMRALQSDLVSAAIDDATTLGVPPGPLYELLGRTVRGEFAGRREGAVATGEETTKAAPVILGTANKRKAVSGEGSG